ncbi:MAG: mechanosensitive ion channel family protein [Candidatus Aminicenantes bacterium]|nr:mechanosensitive ion channel family protein [Candidatus Aminicenantes bacterium]MDH5743147.1 mechanosensitive ion channel family protein [Candidatus Aminicenantes bacterium]
MDFSVFLTAIKNWALTTGIKIILVVVFTLILIKVIKVISKRLSSVFLKKRADEESEKRAKTLTSVIQSFLIILVLVVAAITIIGQLGIEIAPLLATAGIAGVAIGFAGQSLIKDIINGFFLLLWDQIRVGDVVQISDKSGLVEMINLKMTVLRDLAGSVHYIPNGSIDIVTNMTKEYSRYVFEIGVAYREDADEVMDIIREVDSELRKDPDFKEDILEPIEIFGLDKFADSAIIIKARTTTKPLKQWRIGREFNRRLKKKFDEEHIEIPFPHTTLYMGQDKKGKAAPLRVFMEER